MKGLKEINKMNQATPTKGKTMAKATKKTTKKKTNGKSSSKAAKAAAEKETYQSKMSKLPKAKRIEVKLNNSVDRLTRLSDSVGDWKDEHDVGDAREALRSAILHLKKAADIFADVPDDYEPKPKRASRANIEAGMKVAVTDRRRDDYEGILSTKEMDELNVVEVRGNRLRCTTGAGDTILIARGHLRIVDQATA